jgi:hypothetical protein
MTVKRVWEECWEAEIDAWEAEIDAWETMIR